MNGRDNKGRFVKGNNFGKKYRSDDGSASEAGRKGVEVQGKMREFREYLKEALNEEITKPNGSKTTLKDYLSHKLLEHVKEGDIRALELMLKIIGEYPTDKHDVNLTSPQGVMIICENKEQEGILKRLEKKCRG